jgi:probable F420-dependent oxidoreductase
MKIGAVFPQTEFPADPIAIRDYTQTVEGLGFSHVLAYDHILGANPNRPGGWQGPYTFTDSFYEPLALFSFMAGLTTKLEFATGIIILPQRETAVFAKQAAVLDVLCEGRLRIGVGIGWNQVEYEALNQNFRTRGKRIEEQVELLQKLWTEELVTYQGKWHTISDAGLNPMPVQRPIPIWFGGHVEAVMSRIARLGDGWMPNFRTAERAKPTLAILDKYLAENGRSRTDIGIEPRLHTVNGNPDLWQQTITDWAAEGAAHFSFNTMGAGFTSPQQHLDALTHFATHILNNG